jgi:hypothetical protein
MLSARSDKNKKISKSSPRQNAAGKGLAGPFSDFLMFLSFTPAHARGQDRPPLDCCLAAKWASNRRLSN